MILAYIYGERRGRNEVEVKSNYSCKADGQGHSGTHSWKSRAGFELKHSSNSNEQGQCTIMPWETLVGREFCPSSERQIVPE